MQQQGQKGKESVNLKILNDPLYGFISVPEGIVFQLLEHPYFQRLRRIKQLGLTHLVYPGALHTRFHHGVGAMHLMREALEVIRTKGYEVTPDEETGVLIAILLHDIGHGPFSHALEDQFVQDASHEELSSLVIGYLNEVFDGGLETAMAIFEDRYEKRFLHQLVSSQLDMDRLDYLQRDSFYSGVREGVVNSDRLIKMLNIHDDRLVIDQKGIYSIEKFIVARRLMYWQVYLHKTVLSAEYMLMKILERARELAREGVELFCSPIFRTFLYGRPMMDDLKTDRRLLDHFMKLDDNDIMCSVKAWCDHGDHVLSRLCRMLVDRDLMRVQLEREPIPADRIEDKRERVKHEMGLNEKELPYFFFSGTTVNNAYDKLSENILILLRDGTVMDLAEASDNLNISALAEPVEKHFICYPKFVDKN